jgi:hypothetical protein
MRYLVIAILSLAGFGLICLSEYYNDSPKGNHYLEFPIGVAFFYFGLIYILLLGAYELLRGVYRLIKKVVTQRG